MATSLFDPFRLVGGTALALQIGHRMSEDIDLFTDALYDSLDFDAIDAWLRQQYSYVTVPHAGPIGFGRFYFVGNNNQEAIKFDICYTDPFIQPPVVREQIRMATVEEIIAMKIDVIQRRGRKKDFWDIHALLNHYTIEQMIDLHAQRYPYGHDAVRIREQMTNFSHADDDFDPNCLRKERWEFIKLDLIAATS
ncbi:MAG TPA: nucleotidyl transferase AbiEii/AbiGii toxin family protein [Puia sp.]